MRLWNLATRVRVGPVLDRFAGWQIGVAFSPDGMRLAVWSDEDGAMLIELSEGALVAAACRLAGRNLTRSERARDLGAGAYRSTCLQHPTGDVP